MSKVYKDLLVDLTYFDGINEQLRKGLSELEKLSNSMNDEVSFHALPEEERIAFIIKANQVKGLVDGLTFECDLVKKNLEKVIMNGPSKQYQKVLEKAMANAAAAYGVDVEKEPSFTDGLFPGSKKYRDDLN